ncbi:MAG: hypothetical protein KA247_08095 [Bacteroidetes bacterium]|nr:hypothetical protein [Bacteroidota bacterium]
MKNILFLILTAASILTAQSKDSTIIFASPDADILAPVHTEQNSAWGVDILLSNNGFGFAGFYRHQYSRDLFGTLTLGIAESKDDNEVEYFDYWGQSFVPGKINRFLMMPVMVGAQYRLFADDITDSFRPYINGGVGPTVVLASPYDREFFSSLSYGRAHYTMGAYIGVGAFFGADMGSLSGINIRYYYVPFPNGIESLQDPDVLVSPGIGETFTPYVIPGKIRKKHDFGGFFITINLGSAF